ncbi:hypothetical protein SAMN04490202_0816 [Pseudomonas reinekei]|uniref:Uncharacterized protein n=1 Tax=Pseudomonas reinekei TaxID=395598 RepID=A0A1H0JDU0_PSERE|nr:hypothetical protein [Pseudomonas reinekei]KAB0483813.1 hypothetical protein F7R15_19355 [Pseudomonas reinekei]OLU00875.1 hypothetical protein BVK86_20305 [Pseudomonas reinekei]SDO41541.1 hypothetical protein SAMN04490202_0816 [Pseudomonas reinekei]
MQYSRFFYTEYQSSLDAKEEGAFTILSMPQSREVNFHLRPTVGLQRIAILWDDGIDTRVFELMERAFVINALSPVKLLHASEGLLQVLTDQRLSVKNRDVFEALWADLAAGVIFDAWALSVFPEDKIFNPSDGGRIFRNHSKDIVSTQELGIIDYSYNLFLFADEWDIENILYNQMDFKADDDLFKD